MDRARHRPDPHVTVARSVRALHRDATRRRCACPTPSRCRSPRTPSIAVSKGFGWLVTGSPTLFAETVHSLADVGNQVLLKVGEVRGRQRARSRASVRPRPGEVLLGARLGRQRVLHRLRHQPLPRRARAAESAGQAAVLAAGDRPAAVRAGARVVDVRRRAAGDRRLAGHSARTATTRRCSPCCSRTPSRCSASC